MKLEGKYAQFFVIRRENSDESRRHFPFHGESISHVHTLTSTWRRYIIAMMEQKGGNRAKNKEEIRAKYLAEHPELIRDCLTNKQIRMLKKQQHGNTAWKILNVEEAKWKTQSA